MSSRLHRYVSVAVRYHLATRLVIDFNNFDDVFLLPFFVLVKCVCVARFFILFLYNLMMNSTGHYCTESVGVQQRCICLKLDVCSHGVSQ